MDLIEIPGLSRYFVSRDGRLFSRCRGTYLKELSLCPQKARGRKTYLRVKIAGKTWLAHRVAAAAKVGRPLTDSEVVNHLDGNTGNNSLDNLEVTSHKGNVQHAVGSKLYCYGLAWYTARNLEMPGTAGTFND